MVDEAKSILLADDEQGLRDLYHFVLEPLGYEVVTVGDGQAALARLEERPFDLVILDVHMPRIGGPEAVARIRQMRPEQKVILVSSSSDINHTFEQRIRQETGIDCLFKPVTLDELTCTIARAISA